MERRANALNTKKLLNQLYRKIESSISDKELLLGKSYKEYCSKVADGMTSNYGGNTNITIVADESEGAYSAYTDGSSITVNAFCKAYNNIKNLTERHWCVLGRIVHECGHILWTNFKLSKKCQESIQNDHILYPAPVGDQTELKELLDKLPSLTGTIASLWHSLMNCVEDGFIEKLLLVQYPGYGQYLASNREMNRKSCPTYKEMKEKGDKISTLINLVLCQAKYGEVQEFDAEDLNDDVVQTFYSICPIIDSAVDERSSSYRQQKVNDLFLGILHIIIEEINKQQQEQQNQQQGSESQQSQGQSSERNESQTGNQNGEGENSEETEKTEGSEENGEQNNGGEQSEENSEQGSDENGSGSSGQENGSENSESSQSGSGEQSANNSEQNGEGNGNNGSSQQKGSEGNQTGSESQSSAGQGNGSFNPTEEIKKALENASKSAEETSNDGSDHSRSTSPLDDTKKSSSVGEPQQSNNKKTPAESNSLDNIKKNEIQNKVEQEIEKQIKEDVEQEIVDMKTDSSIHRNIPFSVQRVEAERGEYLYNEEHTYLDTLARRMMKNLQKEIRDRVLGDALDGNYFGNRLDTNNLYRRDKKLYIKDILPENVPDMEVSIVVDCSGSMSGENIEQSRRTAYVVWKFCSMLKIPVSVIGHDTDGHEVNIYSVADSDSIDGKDGQRIFGLEAGGCNRDGFALRFAIKKLLKSQAQDKILFVISDGRPNHRYDGYDASVGSADIKDAVANAKKAGISVITAGIGSDAPNIHRIWTEGVSVKRAASFLEIGDLERLPKSFVKVIKTQLDAA